MSALLLPLQAVPVQQEWNDARVQDTVFIHMRPGAAAGHHDLLEEISAFQQRKDLLPALFVAFFLVYLGL